jgi:2-polyprenyl-6-methoxyphenol hydroxylase-like FAD-dependent oxidoreductase
MFVRAVLKTTNCSGRMTTKEYFMHDRYPASSVSARYDVVICGAGPVGLFLASELRPAGLAVLVLEQAQDLCSPLKRLPFGMRGLSVPTIEAFYRRGLLNDLVALQSVKKDSGSSIASTAAH